MRPDSGQEPAKGDRHQHVDVSKPSAARVYDYYLGGAHNFAVDRAFAEQAMAAMPELPAIMRANRAFLRRSVQFCLDAGIRQFLDLGSGIPTVGNVHEVVQQNCPDGRVVYVDNDPVAVAHSRSLLRDSAMATIVETDLRDPEALFAQLEPTGLITRTEPLAVLMVAVLHFVPDADDPVGLVARYRESMTPGSYLVISHATHELTGERGAEVEALYARAATPLVPRTRSQVAELVAGFELVEPGIVHTPLWRPQAAAEVVVKPERSSTYALVARRP